MSEAPSSGAGANSSTVAGAGSDSVDQVDAVTAESLQVVPPTAMPAPVAPGNETMPAPPRVRSRLVRFGARSPSGSPVLEPLMAAVRASHPKADLGLLERAYATAEEAHRGQIRRSGDPYITHPVAVATILADLGMTLSTLAAALLHDTVEDTDYALEQLREDFGEEIAGLVDGVTKLDRVSYGDAAQAETVRKMVVAMSRDIRVLVIKLADRLHNARTWRFVPQESARRKARETLEIYAPLAHRLGMNTIKWELEDLAFATLYPKVYEEIVHLVAERAPARDEYLSVVKEHVNADLRAAKVKATVTGRPKHYYSIYQKMIVRGRDFADIYDLVGVRVLVDSVRDCYAALGALHARWNPVPGRFKDFIAMPKFNMYQSLHTTVIGPGGKPVEIQIRTHEMHRRAEYGVAAHWKYKEMGKSNATADVSGDMAWLRQLVDWQRETADPTEFLDSLRFEIRGAEVYAFTPKGDVIALPVRLDTGGLRLRGTHRGGAPDHGRAGEWTSRPARLGTGERRRRRGAHLEVGGRRAKPGLDDLRQEPTGAEQDPAVVLARSAARRRSSTARWRSPRRCASRTCRSSACCPTSRWSLSPTRCGSPTCHPSTRRSVKVRRRQRRWCTGSSSRWAGSRGPRRTSPRQRSRGDYPRPGRVTRASWSGESRTSGRSSPSAARLFRATRSSASSPGASGVSVHRADCGNVEGLREPGRADGRGRVGRRTEHAVPRPDPGGGTRPQPAALRRDAGALGQPREHPVRNRVHDP